MISRQLPDSPPAQQGASDPISGLTGLCVYQELCNLFHPHTFPSQLNIISPKFQFVVSWPNRICFKHAVNALKGVS